MTINTVCFLRMSVVQINILILILIIHLVNGSQALGKPFFIIKISQNLKSRILFEVRQKIGSRNVVYFWVLFIFEIVNQNQRTVKKGDFKVNRIQMSRITTVSG